MLKLFIIFGALAAPVFTAIATGSPANSAAPNPAPASNIIIPCYLNDYQCIRANLAANSYCLPEVKGMPAKYRLNKFVYHTPYFNASYVDENLVVRNHDKCFVSQFFYNLATDSAVLAIDCPNLDLESNRTLIQHISLAEDTTFSYHIRGNYPLIRLTTTFPHADHLDLCSAFTFADVTALPEFQIDPNDTPTAEFLSQDLSFMDIYERETFFYRAPHLFRYFINSIFCDFGCNF